MPVFDLGGWYQSLTAVLGQERDWYLKIRADAGLKEKFSKYCTGDVYTRGVKLVTMVLKQNGLDTARAEEAYQIIQAHNRKNLKAFHVDFDKRFGKRQGYFKVLRPLVRGLKRK